MPNPPSPRTWVNKEIQPYSVINQEVYSTVLFLLRPPMCKVRQTTTQSIPNVTYTAINWQTEDTDPYNWHSTTNPTRITPTFPGWYRGWHSVGFSNSTAGTYRLSYVLRTSAGGATAGRARRDQKVAPGGYTIRTAGIPFFMPMNGTTDYLEVMAYQDTGAAMSTPVGNNTQSEFFLRFWQPF